MDSEEKQMLAETLRLTEENNKILHKIRKVQRWSLIWFWVKVALIVGVTIGAFYFIEPYLDSAVGFYNSFTSDSQEAERSSFRDFIKKFAD